MSRPRLLIGVLGTHTEVGKTWVSAQLLAQARSRGLRVAARKPVQSFVDILVSRDRLELLPEIVAELERRVAELRGVTTVEVTTAIPLDAQTEKVLLIGEIGGDDEEVAAAYIKASFKKPIFGFISGRSAPPGTV